MWPKWCQTLHKQRKGNWCCNDVIKLPKCKRPCRLLIEQQLECILLWGSTVYSYHISLWVSTINVWQAYIIGISSFSFRLTYIWICCLWAAQLHSTDLHGFSIKLSYQPIFGINNEGNIKIVRLPLSHQTTNRDYRHKCVHIWWYALLALTFSSYKCYRLFAWDTIVIDINNFIFSHHWYP